MSPIKILFPCMSLINFFTYQIKSRKIKQMEQFKLSLRMILNQYIHTFLWLNFHCVNFPFETCIFTLNVNKNV